MAEKKERGRFTIKLNENDPTHEAAIQLLERQPPRTKAQLIVNALVHYMNCPAAAAATHPDAGREAIEKAVPFELAAGTDKWWKIDSTDTAYWAVQENINAMRAAGGLPALTMDDALSTTASSRCESFVAGGPFDHSGMVTRSEICASGLLFSAADVCTAWQNSETHYANIMRSDISRMGVGCWFCEADGSKYTYWTVTFE